MEVDKLMIRDAVMYNGYHWYIHSIEGPLPRNEDRFSDKHVLTIFNGGLITVSEDEIEPIELTSKMLSEIGFTLTSIGAYMDVNETTWIYVNVEGTGIEISNGFKNTDYEYESVSLPIEIKYLHQLQGVYRMIKKQELPI